MSPCRSASTASSSPCKRERKRSRRPSVRDCPMLDESETPLSAQPLTTEKMVEPLNWRNMCQLGEPD